jgi:cellulose synthase/poly-beta-1,6-N-acetylglucosamine synthase-like glycosyltransferase
MTAPILRLEHDGRHRVVPAGPPRLGDLLLRLGAVAPDRLLVALALQPTDGRRLGEFLLSRGWTTEEGLAAALALQHGAERADLRSHPPDARLLDLLGPDTCVRHGLVPWKRTGGVTVVAVSNLSRARGSRAETEAALGPVRFAIATSPEVEEAILALRGASLARRAEHRVPSARSVRGLGLRIRAAIFAAVILLSLVALAAPVATLAIFTACAVLSLVATSGLRAAAIISQLVHLHGRGTTFASARAAATGDGELPVVSLIVPLFREREIAGRLVERLARLDYPPERLDVCLAVEADDRTTREALAQTVLPHWMRQIVVPPGTVRTKPRALNYALDFCRGSIVGIYDAEDAPARDQLRRVVRRFGEAPPEVACLQGVLDFYNARTNWLSRCFTIDYATWFRIVLPGIARLGFVIPLGGTTLFFRRGALEALGGWDAHNVTEDADLGLRLSRHGYRCELIDSVTEEEANCRAIPWIRQRSRWLKGYALTWISHMRRPGHLLRDLGAWKFAGVQILFFGTLVTYLLKPLVWSFWLLPLGLPHPLAGLVPWWLFVALGSAFLVTEIINVAAGALAVSSAKHRWLIPWVPTLHFYHPLGAVASWKAIVELVVRPFYWDKTAHGLYGPGGRSIPPAPPLPRRAEAGSRTRPRYAP